MPFKTIVAPHINVNDLEMKLAQWSVAEWGYVKAGDPICEVETTKSIETVEATESGYLYPVIKEYDIVKVGEPLAHVFPKDDPQQLVELQQNMATESDQTISKKARKLMKEHGLSVADFPQHAVISSETVIAKIRTLPTQTTCYNQADLIKKIQDVEINERSVVLYGEPNQSLLALDALMAADDYDVIAFISEGYASQDFYGLPALPPQALKLLCEKGLKNIYLCGQNDKVKQQQWDETQTLGLICLSVVHPSAVVSSTARIQTGAFIGAAAVVGPAVEIGQFSRILCAATVAHHSRIGAFVDIADGTHIGGNVSIGDRTFIGIGCSINKRIKIGHDAVVVSGATVIDHIADHKTFRQQPS